MGWKCPDCGTTGDVNDVEHGGTCYRCFTPVTWSFGPVSDVVKVDRIKNAEQFNRRALVALEHGAALNSWDQGFLASVRGRVEAYASLGEKEQWNLTRMVLRHCRAVTDKPVVDWAEVHAPKVTA